MEDRVVKDVRPVKMPALIIGGTESGTGKTTFTCGLLRLLQQRGLRPCAFKCGPDYIDPSFHRYILNDSVRNLDLFMTEPDIVRALYASRSLEYDISIIEGAMGYYDGIGHETKASTWELAKALQIPVILLVSAKPAETSLETLLKNFMEVQEDSRIAGVIFNGIQAAGYLEAAKIAEHCGIEALGYLPHEDAFRIRGRHLGLVMPSEAPGLNEAVDHIARCMEETTDLARILQIADLAKTPDMETCRKLLEDQTLEGGEDGPVIGVVKDHAFCFYYEENMEFLRACGAKIAYFSLLYDSELPKGCSALYLGSGYPELFGETLSHNQRMIQTVRAAIMGGMPCVAECGGYLYLHSRIEGAERSMYPMTDVVHADALIEGRLKHSGYVEMTADQDCLLMKKGEKLFAYAFHYWQSKSEERDITMQNVSGGESWKEGSLSETLYAAFPHLYFRGCPEAGLRFVQAARSYRNKAETGRGEGTE